MRFLAVYSSILAIASMALAQTKVYPLVLDGTLDSMSPPRNAADPRSGGTITVNGYSILVPDNLLFAFPATFVPYAEVASAFPGFGGDSGNEVSITGNIVDGVAIAGQVTIAEKLTEFGNGVIESISFDGFIKIVGGPTIRINDPKGKFGKFYAEKPFFACDDENPSISAFSGFPMCIPRGVSDPLCPSTNVAADGTRAFQAPDPLAMSPFLVGDYLEFSGIKVGNVIVCYSIVANAMIFTPPGLAPGYIRMEDALLGVIDNDPNVAFAQSKMIGFTSDPTATINIYAIEVDPCTGVESDRLIVSNVPAEQPAAGANRARFRWLSDRADIGEYTREYHLRLSSGTALTKNNITGGQYVQPVTEWVFPELANIGAPPPSIDFTHLTHLASGFGPDDNGFIFKQLKPWPGRFPAPTPSKICPDKVAGPVVPSSTSTATTSATPVATPVVADAGPDQTVKPGVFVQLAGKNTAPNIVNTDLKYNWTQTSGTTPFMTLTDALTDHPSFTAPYPQTAGITSRTFTLNMTHVSGSFSVDTVIINADNTAKDVVVIDSYNRVSSGGGTVTINAHSNLVGNSAATMSVAFGTAPNTQVAMTKVAGKPGYFLFSSTNIKSTSIIVTSSGGGTDTKAAPNS